MVEQDTIKLLRECDAGVKMGVSSIDDVLDNVQNSEFKKLLTKCKDEHEKLDREIREPFVCKWGRACFCKFS